MSDACHCRDEWILGGTEIPCHERKTIKSWRFATLWQTSGATSREVGSQPSTQRGRCLWNRPAPRHLRSRPKIILNERARSLTNASLRTVCIRLSSYSKAEETCLPRHTLEIHHLHCTPINEAARYTARPDSPPALEPSWVRNSTKQPHARTPSHTQPIALRGGAVVT